MPHRYTDARYEENFPGADYTEEEREFIMAIERYQRERCRRWPTWREVLEVAVALGYRRVAAPRPVRKPYESWGQTSESPS